MKTDSWRRHVLLWTLLSLTSQVVSDDRMRASIFDGAPIRVEDYGTPPATHTIPLYDCTGSHRPKKEEANAFQVFHNGEWYNQFCQEGLLWNQTLCRCEYPGGARPEVTCRDYRPTSEEPAGKYEQFVNGQWIVRDCSLAVAGLVWEQKACQCVWGPDSKEMITGQGITPCDIMLNITFEEGIKDNAKGSFIEVGRGTALPVVRLDKQDAVDGYKAAYFTDTALNIWYFAGNEMGTSLRVEFRFKMTNDPTQRDKYQIFLSNGCNASSPGYTTPSLAIGYRAADQSYLLAFETVSSRKAIVCTRKLGAYDWHTISLIYEDGTLLLRVDEHPCIISQDFTGPIQKTPCPLTLGADPLERESMYKGYLDNLLIARYCRRFIDKETNEPSNSASKGPMPVEAAPAVSNYAGHTHQLQNPDKNIKTRSAGNGNVESLKYFSGFPSEKSNTEIGAVKSSGFGKNGYTSNTNSGSHGKSSYSYDNGGKAGGYGKSSGYRNTPSGNSGGYVTISSGKRSGYDGNGSPEKAMVTNGYTNGFVNSGPQIVMSNYYDHPVQSPKNEQKMGRLIQSEGQPSSTGNSERGGGFSNGYRHSGDVNNFRSKFTNSDKDSGYTSRPNFGGGSRSSEGQTENIETSKQLHGNNMGNIGNGGHQSDFGSRGKLESLGNRNSERESNFGKSGNYGELSTNSGFSSFSGHSNKNMGNLRNTKQIVEMKITSQGPGTSGDGKNSFSSQQSGEQRSKSGTPGRQSGHVESSVQSGMMGESNSKPGHPAQSNSYTQTRKPNGFDHRPQQPENGHATNWEEKQSDQSFNNGKKFTQNSMPSNNFQSSRNGHEQATNYNSNTNGKQNYRSPSMRTDNYGDNQRMHYLSSAAHAMEMHMPEMSDIGNQQTQEAHTDYGSPMVQRGNSMEGHGNSMQESGSSVWDEGNSMGEHGNVMRGSGNSMSDEGNSLGEHGNGMGGQGDTMGDTGMNSKEFTDFQSGKQDQGMTQSVWYKTGISQQYDEGSEKGNNVNMEEKRNQIGNEEKPRTVTRRRPKSGPMVKGSRRTGSKKIAWYDQVDNSEKENVKEDVQNAKGWNNENMNKQPTMNTGMGQGQAMDNEHQEKWDSAAHLNQRTSHNGMPNDYNENNQENKNYNNYDTAQKETSSYDNQQSSWNKETSPKEGADEKWSSDQGKEEYSEPNNNDYDYQYYDDSEGYKVYDYSSKTSSDNTLGNNKQTGGQNYEKGSTDYESNNGGPTSKSKGSFAPQNNFEPSSNKFQNSKTTTSFKQTEGGFSEAQSAVYPPNNGGGHQHSHGNGMPRAQLDMPVDVTKLSSPTSSVNAEASERDNVGMTNLMAHGGTVSIPKADNLYWTEND